MTDTLATGRPVRLYTQAGLLEGCLSAGKIRTLDELNRGKQFLTIEEPRGLGGLWALEHGPLSLNRDAVLFVIELGRPAVLPEGQYGRFTRASIQLQARDYLIQGFVHVLPGGVALKRFDHDHHPFIALTSALIRSVEAEFTAPFIAVNRTHVIAAQPMGLPEPGGYSERSDSIRA